MRRLLCALLFLFLVSPCFSWAPGFKYAKLILINNTQNPYNLSDYQYVVKINWKSPMQDDFDDLRFYYINNTTEEKIPYYIDFKQDGSYAYVWLRIPYTPAYGYSKIVMYYGNSTVSSESNASAVFYFYEDFTGPDLSDKWTVLDPSHYTLENGYIKLQGGVSLDVLRANYTFSDGIIEFKVKGEDDPDVGIFYRGDSVSSSYQLIIDPLWSAENWYFAKDYSSKTYGTYSLYEGDWYVARIIAYGTNHSVGVACSTYSDDCSEYINLQDSSYLSGRFGITQDPAEGVGYIDWIRVRAYLPQKPSYSIYDTYITALYPPSPAQTQDSSINFKFRIRAFSSSINCSIYINSALENSITLTQEPFIDREVTLPGDLPLGDSDWNIVCNNSIEHHNVSGLIRRNSSIIRCSYVIGSGNYILDQSLTGDYPVTLDGTSRYCLGIINISDVSIDGQGYSLHTLLIWNSADITIYNSSASAIYLKNNKNVDFTNISISLPTINIDWPPPPWCVTKIPIMFYADSQDFCSYTFNNVEVVSPSGYTGDVLFYNSTATLKNKELAELILCNADGSYIQNVTLVSLYTQQTDNTTFRDINIKLEGSEISGNNNYISYLRVPSQIPKKEDCFWPFASYYILRLIGNNNTVENFTVNGLYYIQQVFYVNGNNNTLREGAIYANTYDIYDTQKNTIIGDYNKIYDIEVKRFLCEGLTIMGDYNYLANLELENCIDLSIFGDYNTLTGSHLTSYDCGSGLVEYHKKSGVYIDGHYNNIISNTVSVSKYPIIIGSTTSTYNYIYNNYLCPENIFCYSSSGPNYWNATEEIYGKRIYVNTFSLLGGNYYCGFSDNCDDKNGDGFCDSPKIFYDPLNPGIECSGNRDYRPLAKRSTTLRQAGVGGSAGGGLPPPPTKCGNGICDPDEDPKTCPIDCLAWFTVSPQTINAYLGKGECKVFTVNLTWQYQKPPESTLIKNPNPAYAIEPKSDQIFIFTMISPGIYRAEVPVKVCIPEHQLIKVELPYYLGTDTIQFKAFSQREYLRELKVNTYEIRKYDITWIVVLLFVAIAVLIVWSNLKESS